MREEKKIVEIVLMADELLQDIKNEGWLQAQAVEAPADAALALEAANKKTELKDIAERVSGEKVRRMMDLSVDEVLDLLHPFSQEVIWHPSTVVTNRYREVEIYRLSLLVPANYPQGSINMLRSLAHEYVISNVMKEVMMIQNPKLFEIYSLKVENIKVKIGCTKNKRIGMMRRKVQGWM